MLARLVAQQKLRALTVKVRVLQATWASRTGECPNKSSTNNPDLFYFRQVIEIAPGQSTKQIQLVHG